MKTLFTSVLFGLALCALQADCMATTDSGDGVPIRTVKYADLNLTRPADVAVLYSRIEGAATLLCDAQASRNLTRVVRARQCMTSAIERAVADVHAPLLSQHYAAVANRQILAPQTVRLNR